MGACDFRVRAKGATAKEAFRDAVDQARSEHGSGGYTGTIAEKSNYSMQPRPPERDLETFVEELTERADKWGPAFCVPMGEGEWLFVGTASS